MVSARRSSAEQIQLRKVNCGTSDYDIYQKPSGECRPVTARPGESKHESGLAVDFGGDLNLVAELAPKYGLGAPIASERWHYELEGSTPGAGDGEGAPAASSSSGGGGGFGSNVLGNVPIIGGALESAWGLKDALGALVGFVTNPKNWLRLLAAWAGGLLIIAGAAIIGLDAVRPSGASVGDAAMAAA